MLPWQTEHSLLANTVEILLETMIGTLPPYDMYVYVDVSTYVHDVICLLPPHCLVDKPGNKLY